MTRGTTIYADACAAGSSEESKRVAAGVATKRGNIIPCEAGHPMYVAIDDINPGDVDTWGNKLVRCDGGPQPDIGSEDWTICARCHAPIARALWPA